MNTSPKRLLIYAVIFFALSCGVFVFLYHSINNNRKVFHDAMAAWQREEDRLAEIRLIDRSINEVETEKALFEAHFASKLDVVPFLDNLEKLAKSVGASAEVASVDTKDGASGLIVALRTSGSFESLYKLIMLLENAPYELRIESIDLQRDSFVDAGVGLAQKWRAVIQVKLLSYVD